MICGNLWASVVWVTLTWQKIWPALSVLGREVYRTIIIIIITIFLYFLFLCVYTACRRSSAASTGAVFSAKDTPGSLSVVKLPLHLWGFNNQRPTLAEVRHPTRGTILPQKCRNDITAVSRPGCVLAKCPVWPRRPPLPLFFLVALSVYSLPCRGVARGRGGGGGSGAISCINPLSPQQYVSLAGLVSLALRSCCLTSAHNGILKVPCGQLWPLSISPHSPVSGCWLVRQTGGWVIVQHLHDSHAVWLSCFVRVLAKAGLLLKKNTFCLSFNCLLDSWSSIG